MSDALSTVPYGQATLPIQSSNGFNWDGSGRLITITLDSAALPLQAQGGYTFDANGALLINTTVPPAYAQTAISQAIAVVSRLGGRVYFAPFGFSPYAYLNSDRSGGTSSAAGALVGAAVDQSYGLANGTVIAPAGNDAIQATTANKPIIAAGPSSLFNGFAFDGTNDQLNTGALAPSAVETLVVSGYVTAASTNGMLARRTSNLDGEFAFRSLPSGSLQLGTWVAGAFTAASSSGGAISNNVPFVATGVKAAARNYVRLNGVEVGTVAAANVATVGSPPMSIGFDGSGFFAGPMFFAARIPSEPTAAEFAILERAAGICAGTVTS